MSPDRQSKFEILVIGGGPAGMAAAVRAAERSGRVGLVDDNPAVGGQIWRASASHDTPEDEQAQWRDRLSKSSVVRLCGTRVFHQPEPGILLAETNDDLCELHYEKLILATGARERFLPLPGWTLQNVMGAGGLQAMVKSGLPIRGKRILVAGSGPLLLAVAAYLRKHGADVRMICEQASWATLARFSLGLLSYREKISQGLQLKKTLVGVPFSANSWPVEAHGNHVLESVTIFRAGKRESIVCDYLACGFHMVPNTELQQLLGCKLQDGCVQVNEFQESMVPGIFCAGEPTGIGGVEQAIVEGQIAGLAATGRGDEARQLFSVRTRARRFARMLDRAFHLRPELQRLASDSTIVCCCEDVPYARLQPCASWREAKLHTRCGMGPCQGRICGPATEFLFGWTPESVRPPIFPARVGSIASHQATKNATAGSPSGGHS
jgi:D-hydroxyproline dehydrogenase subunit alpha